MRVIKGVKSIGVMGLIVIAFSLSAFFLLDIERIALYGCALTFLLLSEFVLFGGLIGLRLTGVNHSRVFVKTGLVSVLFLYFFSTLISVLCASFFRESFSAFVLIELAIIAFFAIIALSVLSFSRKIRRNNEEDGQKVGTKEPRRGGF